MRRSLAAVALAVATVVLTLGSAGLAHADEEEFISPVTCTKGGGTVELSTADAETDALCAGGTLDGSTVEIEA
ncbi:hypothetical protein [Streptomyces sp. SID3343]|uniref:hypothetical protein n=1 Tax=Streptomyces sp. SID3343 TaxID=2690260 RepID=UPI0013BFC791|nr:hypothetical protein [Streptomyces sp. SID3343]MYW05927.1 hypothetical protein [Streptomyces sp. SID3343]